MRLIEAEVGREYRIRQVTTGDEALEAFLFSLGCYEGESVTVIAQLKSNYVVAFKEARYSIDRPLAAAITVEETDV